MADVIQLLPDNIANQIAAGEVIQRPASVVKELMENAIDAGASNIKLILKDSGKTLIQVIDDGIGMSDTDARLCFERHATSKIRKADDLFKISTKGFRGEALASIASVSQVELKTKTAEEEIGTLIKVEGSQIIEISKAQCDTGTSFCQTPGFKIAKRSDRLYGVKKYRRPVCTYIDRITFYRERFG